MAIVYQHRRIDNNSVFYIGIGADQKRAYETKSRNRYWNHIVNKVGYEVDILHTDLSWEDACKWEIYLIGIHGREDLGEGHLVNQTSGGDGTIGVIVTEETKRIIKEKATGRKHPPRSEQARLNISNSKKGKPNPKVAGDLSPTKRPEVRAKMSEAQKGEKSRMFGRTGPLHQNYGMKFSEEVNKSKGRSGELNCNYGKRGEECTWTRRGKEKSNSRPIQKVSIDTGEVVSTYYGTREASREGGIDRRYLMRVLSGEYESAKGYYWKYS